MVRKPNKNGNAAKAKTAPLDEPSDAAGEEDEAPAASNGHAHPRRRRATAQSMAASQRDISVSEFFAKNRHLLGFDNPRKALLTTVKEAVDNSLDACEEAGILPEIWVHIEADRRQPLQGRRAGQRPGHRQKADPADLRQAALRLEVSPPADEPRPAGHRHQRRRHVRRADDRQAGEDHLARSRERKPAHYYEIQIDTKKQRARDPQRQAARASTFRPASQGSKYIEKHGIEWVESHARHAGHDRAGRPSSCAAAAASTNISSRRPSPIRTSRCTTSIPDGNERDYPRARPNQLPPEPKEIKPHPYGVELGRLVAMLQDAKASTISQFLTSVVLPRQLRPWPRKICETAKLSTRANATKIGRNEADALYQAIQQTQDRLAGDRLHLADRRRAVAQGLAPGRAGRVLRRRPRGRRPSIAAIRF